MAGPIRTDDRPETKLSKLLPAEVTGLYVTISGLIATSKSQNTDKIMWVTIVLIAIAGLLYLIKTLKIVNRIHLFVYTVSFFLWAATLNAQTLNNQQFGDFQDIPLWLAIAATLWTFIVPTLLTSEMVASQEHDGTPIVRPTKLTEPKPDNVVDLNAAPVDPNPGTVQQKGQ